MWTKSHFTSSGVELYTKKWEFRSNKKSWAGNLLWPDLNLEKNTMSYLKSLKIKNQEKHGITETIYLYH